MGWNPFDIGQSTDPKRNAWVHSDHIRRAKPDGVDTQKAEVARTMAAPLIVVVVVAALRGNADLMKFWLSEPGWLALMQGAAVLGAAAALVLLARLAARRYASSVAEEGMPAVPGWFRLLLASIEIGQVAATLGLVLSLGLDLDGRWFDAPLVCVAIAFALAITHFLIRWRAESFGWVTGRIFWGRMD